MVKTAERTGEQSAWEGRKDGISGSRNRRVAERLHGGRCRSRWF